MVVSLLVLLRNRNIPLPAGAVLISPWCDLTHSFPSVAHENPLDYIPSAGFHHKPSRAWPPPNEKDLAELREKALKRRETKKKDSGGPSSGGETEDQSSGVDSNGQLNPEVTNSIDTSKLLSVDIDGKKVMLMDQIQVSSSGGNVDGDD